MNGSSSCQADMEMGRDILADTPRVKGNQALSTSLFQNWIIKLLTYKPGYSLRKGKSGIKQVIQKS